MGLYYNPPPPHIGASQPLTPAHLDPPQSGPAPQNPVFGVPSLLPALIAAWLPAQPLPIAGPRLVPLPVAPSAPPVRTQSTPAEVLISWLPAPPLPPRAINLDPPISGPAPQNPPFAGGAKVSAAALVAWLPPPPQAPVALDLDPPIAGPASQNPPFAGGARIPGAVLVAWLPPAPLPPSAVNLDPPIAGPTPQPPPFGLRNPPAIDLSWRPSASPVPLPTFNPALFTTAAQYLPPAPSLAAILEAWRPAPQGPIPFRAPVPPSGPAPQNPPFAGGARIGQAVLASWVQTLGPPLRLARLPPLPGTPLVQTRRYTVTARFAPYLALVPQRPYIAVVPYAPYIAIIPGNTMPATKDLPAIAPNQVQTFICDFGNFLPPGVTLIGTPSVTVIRDVNGADPSPAIVVGSPQIGTALQPPGTGVASAAVLQQTHHGIDGALYLIEVTCPRSDNDVAEGYFHLPCKAPH